MIWHCGQYDFDTSTPIIMGILNVTPDSFSDGGAYLDPKAAVAHGLEMVRAGAAIVDVGGESTRPGATPVTPDEEWDRIGEVVAALVEAGVCVSVDTRHAEVAVRALHAGASIVNDVSGFRDPAMREAVRRCGCGCVVMHMKGEPGTMQQNPQYDDVVAEVRDYLRDQAAMLEAAGVAPERLVAVAGTATTVVAVRDRMRVYDSAKVHKAHVTRQQLDRQYSELAAMPLERRSQVVGLDPGRAPVIVAGLVIMQAVMDAVGVDGFTVSETDILHGIILDAAKLG